MVITMEETEVVMVRTLGNFWCPKNAGGKDRQKRPVGILREIFLRVEPATPRLRTRTPRTNRCLSCSHHVWEREAKNKNKKALLVAKSANGAFVHCGVTRSRLICAAGAGEDAASHSSRIHRNYNSFSGTHFLL